LGFYKYLQGIPFVIEIDKVCSIDLEKEILKTIKNAEEAWVSIPWEKTLC